MDEKFVFLIESPHPWGGVWQRPHHLTSRIARFFPCHYIYPQYIKTLLTCPISALRQRNKSPQIKNLKIHNLTLYNGERFPFVLNHNRKKLSRIFLKLSQKYKDYKRVLWIYNPHNGFLADKIPYEILVYDIMDEYSGFPWSPQNVEEEERELLKKATCVFAGTNALLESKRKYAENKIFCYLSGVEFEHFNKTTSDSTDIPQEILKIKKKAKAILGYMGMVDVRIDQELILNFARKNPDGHFILIGPVVGDFSKLRPLANVHLLGQRPYNLLPNYIKGFDICLIPFILNKLTLHINPTKILEYFAGKRFVISSPIPDLVNLYPDLVGFYDSAEKFEFCIKDFLENKNKYIEKIKTASSLAEQNSWESKLKGILSHLGILI